MALLYPKEERKRGSWEQLVVSAPKTHVEPDLRHPRAGEAVSVYGPVGGSL